MRIPKFVRLLFVFPLAAASVLVGSTLGPGLPCGPFTDLGGTDPFCPFVLQIFTLGITTGVTATTYDPNANVTRLQMAAFLSRTVDRTLQRSSRKAAVVKYWRPQNSLVLGLTTVGLNPVSAHFDGADVWVANEISDTVSRVRASDGKLLETWTGAIVASGIESAMGRIIITGGTAPGRLYQIDPTQPPGVVTTVVSTLPGNPTGIAFDGGRFWTTSFDGHVVMVTPGAIPWSFSTVTTGFTSPRAAIFDGTNVWVTDVISGPGKLHKLAAFGAILQTVTVDNGPSAAVFDGTNIWVTNQNTGTVSVVRASNGAVLTTLTGFTHPAGAGFDGERILVTDLGNDIVSLWKAADLTSLGFVSAGGGNGPRGVCSDGANFWITLSSVDKLARF
ncbi:MAG TPA: S-layer homology domain-containing protein [Thermoanaerobaculia bacterium]|nr:S-layer homology domain-containing protein [Thermoanaerobaculia bacterium]